jgi:hypothetical protein
MVSWNQKGHARDPRLVIRGDKIDQKEEKGTSPDRRELLILVATCVIATMLCAYLIFIAL